MQIATLPRLARTPTPELIEHLEDAVAAKKLALAEAVRLEFRGRPERERQELRDRYSATFSKLEVPRPQPRRLPSARSRRWRRSVGSASTRRPRAGLTRSLA
jgi:hypothetical protein